MQKELSHHAQAAWDEIEKCTSCGLCKDVCPTFALTHREADGPRGRINLLRELLEEKLDPTAEAVEIYNRCLLCYACQNVCPAGVATERVWISARELLADEIGRPFAKSFFLHRVLPQPRLRNFALSIGRRLPGPEDSIKLRSWRLPRPALRQLHQLIPEVVEPTFKLIGSVAFFPGCLSNFIFPQLAVQAIEILAHLGYRVITPAHQVCCGAPAFNNGDLASARKLAERNLELFTALDVDAIVSPDATCGGAFQHEYELLFPPTSAWRNHYTAFRDQVVNYAEFLDKAIGLHEATGHRNLLRFRPLAYRITVHDSCHLKHLQHKADLPRRLLAHIPDLQLIESSHSDLCCGFGGSYSVYYPHDASAITRRKLDYLRQSGSDTIIVGSPGCLWKLSSEAQQMNLDVRVVHYLELIWESLLGLEQATSQSLDPAGITQQ